MKIFKKKNVKLIVTSLSILLFGLICFSSVVKADFFPGGRKNNAAPYAYYHSTVSGYGYTGNYDAGRSYWNSSSKVNIKKTNGTIGRPDLYYIGTTSTPGLIGRIIPCNSAGVQVSTGSYWDYATVFMYDNQMKALSNYTNSRINYNAAHEIGHTLKMAHVTSPYNSVMVQGWYNIPSSLTNYDSGEINKKW